MYPARQQKYVRLHIADIENEGGCSQDLSRQQSLFPTFSSVRTPRLWIGRSRPQIDPESRLISHRYA